MKYFISIFIVLVLYIIPSHQKQKALVVNVKNFGAIGNGITDDSKAIQNSFNFIKKNGGGTVYFPTGEYLISRTNLAGKSWCLVGVDNLTILGEDKKQSILKLAPNQQNFTRMLVLDKVNNVNLLNISFNGNVKDQKNPLNPNEHLGAVFINSSSNLIIKNCNFTNTGGDGIGLRGVKKASSNVLIDSCYFNANYRNGITLGSGFQNITISNNFFGSKIDDSPIDTEPSSGKCEQVKIFNNSFNSPSILTISGYNNYNLAKNFHLYNNIFNNCSIFLTRAKNVIIENNKIENISNNRENITCLGKNDSIVIKDNFMKSFNKPLLYLVKTKYSKEGPKNIEIFRNNFIYKAYKKDAVKVLGAKKILISQNNFVTNDFSQNTAVKLISNYSIDSIFIEANKFVNFKNELYLVRLKNRIISNVSVKKNEVIRFNKLQKINILKNF